MTNRTDRHCNPLAPKGPIGHPTTVRNRIGETLKDSYAKGRRYRRVGFSRENAE